MEATLKYNLPEEQTDFESAINGVKWSSLAWELDQYLRSQLKYNDRLSEEQHDVLQETRDKLHEIKGEYGLIFD